MIFIRLLFFCGAVLAMPVANAQTFNNNTAKYENLYRALSHPDSMYVYEVSLSDEDGVAYFICFKNASVKSGYYVSTEYLNHLLIARSLMPQDSINKLFRVVEMKAVNSKAIISKIQQAAVFGFRNTGYDFCANNVDDGLY